MERNNFNIISATGLKFVEIDELNAIIIIIIIIIINNEGLQYSHQCNILIPTVSQGFINYNLQEEMDNIMISNTKQDLELIQLHAALSTVTGNITNLGVLAGTANINALVAIDLAK